MDTSDAASVARGGDEGVRDSDDNEARSEMAKSTSYASLWGSSAGVASVGMNDDDDDNYGFSSPELKDCCKAVVANVGAVTGGDSSQSDDTAPDKSRDNDNDDDGQSSDDSEESVCENLAQTRDAFKDPFPKLSPIPQMPRKSLQSSYSRPNARSASGITMPNLGSDSYSTPPHAFFAPQTPPMSRASTPNALSVQTTPTNASCSKGQTAWNDPFPTPDISVHSRMSMSCSSRVKADDEEHDCEKFGKMNLNEEWEDLVHLVPRIPAISELPFTNDDLRPGRSISAAKSSPRLQSLDTDALPVRKTSSESNLPLTKRPSLESLWGALRSGPDGNELVTESDLTRGSQKVKRRNSEKADTKADPLQYDEGENGNYLRRRRKSLPPQQNSSGSPAKTPESAIQSPLMASPDNEERYSDESDDTRKYFKRNSATITNVSGADLANEVKMMIGKREGAPGGSMTPIRRGSRAWSAIKANTPAGELIFSPVKSVAKVYRANTQRAKKLVRNTREKLKERKERRRQRRLARMREPPRSWWIVIPADHPYKIAWDVMTMIWAMLGAYRTHVRIRDRVFDQSPLIILTEIWFTLDLLLNFVTEHKTRKGEVIRDGKAVWARYLTTWFLIDILSLIPWERIYVRPIVEKIKKRNVFQKTFFRSKAVVRVSRVLRGRHIKLFGRVSKQTGTPLRRLVALVIKYLPKYLVFLRNMKGALVLRALRFVHWLHNMYKKIWVKAKTARQNYMARRASRRNRPGSFFSMRSSNEPDTDTESDEDDHSDIDDGDNYDDETSDNDSMLLTNFHRAHSEGSPLQGPRRRSFSQNAVITSS